MAKAKQIYKEYVEYISQEMIDNFGASYQVYKKSENNWRQQIEYKPSVETFLFDKTGLFLVLMDKVDRHNLNSMYSVCYNISDYLAEYLVKKAATLNKEEAKQKSMKKIYFNNGFFVKTFKKIFTRPIDITNENYVKSNPGVVKMAEHLSKQYQ